MTTTQNRILVTGLLISGIIIQGLDFFKSDFLTGALIGIGFGLIVFARIIFKKKQK
jgi:hypothetical protein